MTNFCFRFPSKEEVLNYVVKITKNHLKIHPRTLVVVGAYSIGKECVYLAISKALGVCMFLSMENFYFDLCIHSIPFSFQLSFLLTWRDVLGKKTYIEDLQGAIHSNFGISSYRHFTYTYENIYFWQRSYLCRQSSSIPVKNISSFIFLGWTFSEKISNDLELIKPVSKGNITIYGKINCISTTTDDIKYELVISTYLYWKCSVLDNGGWGYSVSS